MAELRLGWLPAYSRAARSCCGYLAESRCPREHRPGAGSAAHNVRTRVTRAAGALARRGAPQVASIPTLRVARHMLKRADIRVGCVREFVCGLCVRACVIVIMR